LTDITGLDVYVLYSQYTTVIRAVLILVAGLFAAKLASILAGRLTAPKFGGHVSSVTKNITFYVLAAATLFAFLGVFNINLTGVLAAAGILGIAIGFAAQTSVGNMISGFFVIADKPFEIGDAIELEGQSGYVLDITLLSTRIRTFDNRYLRIPNSAVMNAKIVNLSKYEIRRLDLVSRIAPRDELAKALEIADSVIRDNDKVLVEPGHEILITNISEDKVDLEIRAWVPRNKLFAARTELLRSIREAFDAAGIG